MWSLKKITRAFLIVLLMLSSIAYADITNYQQTFIPGYIKTGQLRIAIRQFNDNHHFKFLIVNPYNFKTFIIDADQLYSRNPNKNSNSSPGYFQWRKIKETPYVKALFKFTQYHKLQNDGITHAIYPTLRSLFLTVDMCPSVNPFESEFFHFLAYKGKMYKEGFPVAISISGLWLIDHHKDFKWLLNMQKRHLLHITWVNHSFSHLYFPDLPFKDNFLLFAQTNLKSEILTTERLLIAAHQIPSIFIRFPGLIANEKVMHRIRKYGLIPLGADAWLAKGEKPTHGAIILVHGNGNEQKGVEMVMTILKGKWNWLSIDKVFLPQRSNSF